MEAPLLMTSGRYVDPLNLRPSDVVLDDVAYGLSNQARFTGQTTITIAEHSVRVSLAIESAGHGAKLALWGLLHDAAEYVLQDLPRTLKVLPEFEPYREIEARVEAVIAEAFGLPLDFAKHPVVKEYDRVLLATERRDLLPHDGTIDGEPAGYDYGFAEYVGDVVPLPFPIETWSRSAARRRFVERWVDLMGRLGYDVSQPEDFSQAWNRVYVGTDVADGFRTSVTVTKDDDGVVTVEGVIREPITERDPGDETDFASLSRPYMPLKPIDPIEAPEEESICAEADRLVSYDRQDDYGHPLDDFSKVTEAAKALGIDPITGGAEHHALYMVIVKIARETNRPKRDNRVDGAGYFKTLDMVITERERRAREVDERLRRSDPVRYRAEVSDLP